MYHNAKCIVILLFKLPYTLIYFLSIKKFVPIGYIISYKYYSFSKLASVLIVKSFFTFFLILYSYCLKITFHNIINIKNGVITINTLIFSFNFILYSTYRKNYTNLIIAKY